MARYQTLSPTFIAPNLLPEGTIFTIGDDYEPGPHLLPLDDAAEKAMAKWEKKVGKAAEAAAPLDLTTGMTVEGTVGLKEPEVLDLASAQTERAKPGPTDGGKIESAAKPVADPSPLPDPTAAPPPPSTDKK